MQRSIRTDVRLDKDNRPSPADSRYGPDADLVIDYNKALVTQNLEKIGTQDFQDIDLDNFKNLYDLKNLPPNITAATFQDPAAKLTVQEIRFLAEMRAVPVNGVKDRNWKNAITDHLVSMLNFGHSDGLRNIYKYIFTPAITTKYDTFSPFKQALDKIGKDEFGPSDLDVFKTTFNLTKGDNLNVDFFQKEMTQLTKEEVAFLVKMRANPKDCDDGWKPTFQKPFPNMLSFGYSDGLRDIYKHIFTPETVTKYEKYFQTKQVLEKMGSKTFSDSDLTNFKSIFNINDDKKVLTVDAFNATPPLKPKEVEFLATMRMNDLVNGRTWKLENAKHYFTSLFNHDYSKGFSSLCPFIFGPVARHNYELFFETKQILGKVGTSSISKDDLLAFKDIYNLTDPTLTEDVLQNMPKLNDNEILHLAKMRAGVVNGAKWDPNNNNHFLKILHFGLSDSVCAVYKHIFTAATMQKCVEIGNQIQLGALVFANNNDLTLGELNFAISNGTGQPQALVRGYLDSASRKLLSIKIGQEEEKLSGVSYGVLKSKIANDKDMHKTNYNLIAPGVEQQFQRDLLIFASGKLSSTLKDSSTLDRTHRVQGMVDASREGDGGGVVFVDVQSQVVPFKGSFNKEGEFKNSQQFSPVIKNTIEVLVDQTYRSVWGNPLGGVVEQMGYDADKLDVVVNASTKEANEKYTFVFPPDFETSHKITLKAMQLVRLRPLESEISFTFSDQFYQEIEKGTALDSKELGIQNFSLDKLEIKDAIQIDDDN